MRIKMSLTINIKYHTRLTSLVFNTLYDQHIRLTLLVIKVLNYNKKYNINHTVNPNNTVLKKFVLSLVCIQHVVYMHTKNIYVYCILYTC